MNDKKHDQHRIRGLLRIYQRHDGGVEPQAALRDLLTDLRHVCKEDGLKFNKAAIGSREVFLEELEQNP